MRKLIFLLPVICCLTATVPVYSDDKSATNVAPITSFVPEVGQQLQYNTAQIVSNTRVTLVERVTLKELTPKIKIQVESILNKKVLATSTIEWGSIPENAFREILDKFKPELKTLVISNKRFQYVSVTIRDKVFWLVTDGKKPVYPGILKIATKHNDHEHVDLQLMSVIDPPKAEKK